MVVEKTFADVDESAARQGAARLVGAVGPSLRKSVEDGGMAAVVIIMITGSGVSFTRTYLPGDPDMTNETDPSVSKKRRRSAAYACGMAATALAVRMEKEAVAGQASSVVGGL